MKRNSSLSRPFNSELLYSISEAERKYPEFLTIMAELRERKKEAVIADRSIINKAIYSLQQCLGFALDAGTAMGVEPNTARKINGDLFERLVYLVIRAIGLNCRSGGVKVPVRIEGHAQFHMNYQHDLIIESSEGELQVIGSVKTTSKDRVDKIFIDKFLYCRLTDTCIPHIAVFLHDVQRAKTKAEDRYNVHSTFLSGHFKGYTVKLNPLDGVYYFDIRPSMVNDSILSQQIRQFDHLVCCDIWEHVE